VAAGPATLTSTQATAAPVPLAAPGPQPGGQSTSASASRAADGAAGDSGTVSAASIAKASGLQNADLLRVGQVLTVPSQPGWLYRVQAGETLDQIAARTGVPSALIASASSVATDAVQPGDVLLIPDQSASRGK